MALGICPLSAVAVRNTSAHSSEMLSQLLFGELIEILDTKGRTWAKVRCLEDQCVGWVAQNQIKNITPAEFENYQSNFAFVLDFLHSAMADDHYLPLTIGARLPGFDGLRFQLGEIRYQFSGQAVFPKDIEPTSEILLKIARKYLNAPFLKGGRTPLGIDSSGLAQLICRFAGLILPRDAELQVESGETVDFVEQALPGDLAFFENQLGRITHVGIVFPEQQVLHVSGKVRLDPIDHFGAFNKDIGRYTHRLRVIKRLLNRATTVKNTSNAAVSTALSNQFELF